MPSMSGLLTASLASLPVETRTAFLRSLTPEELTELEADSHALIRNDLHAWCVEALAIYGQLPAAHHRLLIREFEWLERTPNAMLAIFMPPGSAKSTYSRLFMAWWIARHPYTNLIGISYGADLAQSNSQALQSIVRENARALGYALATESMERWKTTNGANYLAAGAGAAVTGFRGDLVVIDDPVKGREAADSQVMRDKIWNSYLADIYTRRKPGCRFVLIQTRWHEDDFGGRVLARDAKRWRVVKLPAYASEANDPLGRARDEPLWNDDAWGYGKELADTKAFYEREGATREWASLYQQEPRPVEGALFKTSKVEVLDVAPNLRGAVIARGWDLAATKKIGTRDPDWTVGVKLARLATGQYLILDVFRDRGGPDDVDAWIKNITAQDGHGVKVSIPEDPGQAGKGQSLAFVRLLSGYQVETSRETGEKTTRAAPVISQVNGGNFAMVRAPWNAALLDEMAAFPSGAHDDQVDALSRAFSVVGLGPRPLSVNPTVLEALARR